MPGDHLPAIVGGLNVTGEPGTLVATGEGLSLDQVAARAGYSVDEQIALQDAGLRQTMADRIIRAFTWANAVVLAAVGVLVTLDEINIAARLIAPSDRIITPQVFMALLGATTVQVGTIAAIIARYLFPGRSRGD